MAKETLFLKIEISENSAKKGRKVLMICLFLCMLTGTAHLQAQNGVSLNLENVPLEEAIITIENQTSYRFLFNKNLVDASQRVSVKAQNQSIETVMTQLLSGTGIGYSVNDRQIVLRPLETKSESGTVQGGAHQVSGRILDTSGEPIIGATVLIKGSGRGTVTDFDGNFTIDDVSQDSYIIVSYIGYQTAEFPALSTELSNLILQEDTELLDEVVVVGYGVQKKSSLTGSVASISATETNKQITSNIASALQGRAPGIDIVQQGGIAGAGVSIVIRGAASFGATEPLYVIDGAFSSSGLGSVNPNDIESIEILKDGAAAAIYGSRAANGVVLITTKTGEKGVPVVQIDASYSFQQPTNKLEYLNASEWRDFANHVADNSGLPRAPENVNPTNPNLYTKWEDLWLQQAPIYNVNASISGGGENSHYSTSLGYFDQTGMTIFSDYQRYNFRINSGFTKGRFSLSENLALTYRNSTPTTPFNIALPTLPLYDEEGRLTSGGPEYYINPEDGKEQNKLAPLYNTDRSNKTVDILGGLTGSFSIMDGLQYRLSFSGNYVTTHAYTHTPQYFSKYFEDGLPNEDYGNPRNTISESRGGRLNYTIDNLLSFNKSFGLHNIDALLGVSWMREFYRGMSINTLEDVGAPNVTGFNGIEGRVSASDSNSALLSQFGRINYDYDNRYLLSLSLRRDESSKFHKDQRVGYFPSISTGWNLHQESWFENPVIDRLKIRASYGELGANFLDPYNFDAIAYGPIPYTLNGVRFTNGRAAYLKSKDLKWETSRTSNIGLEMGFLNNSLSFTAEYFVKKNVDLLAQIDLNLSSGQIFEINSSREKPYVNTASVENSGWEFMLSYRKQLNSDFSVDINANLSTLQNKVLALGTNIQPITSGAYSSFFNDAPSITLPGEPIGSFYGYKIDGFDADGNFIFTDTDQNGIINANDKVILGNPIPDFSYGLNTTIIFRDFDLTMFWQGVSGNEIFNAMKYRHYFDYSNNSVKDVLNSWRPDNTNTGIPVMKTQNTNGGNSLPSEFYIEDGSYIRLKNLQLGYTLPENVLDRIGINNARIYCGVQNLLTFTNYTGSDPEVSSNVLFSRGIDNNSYPNARTAIVGFNLTF